MGHVSGAFGRKVQGQGAQVSGTHIQPHRLSRHVQSVRTGIPTMGRTSPQHPRLRRTQRQSAQLGGGHALSLRRPSSTSESTTTMRNQQSMMTLRSLKNGQTVENGLAIKVCAHSGRTVLRVHGRHHMMTTTPGRSRRAPTCGCHRGHRRVLAPQDRHARHSCSRTITMSGSRGHSPIRSSSSRTTTRCIGKLRHQRRRA